MRVAFVHNYRLPSPPEGSLMPPEGGMDVSIILACRNEAKAIHELLACVEGQVWGPLRWELLIADGDSEDGTAEILHRYAAQRENVTILQNVRRIVSPGLNLAIRRARGELILRMDAHTVYAPDYVETCLRVMKETGGDNVGGPARTKPRNAVERLFSAAYHSPFSCGGARFHNAQYEGWVDTVPYGCWRRELFERIGYFDESLVRNQDDEFNLRLRRSGGRIWQSPAIASWYTPRSSVSQLWKQYFQYGFWKVAVIRKHQIPASLRHLVPPAFVIFSGLSVLAWGVALTTGSASATALRAFTGGFYAIYVLACMAAAAAAWRKVKTGAIVFLPLLFPVYHFAYGSGFLAALLFGRSLKSSNMTAGLSR